MAQYVIRTIADDGSVITHLEPADRVLGVFADNRYLDALALARLHRTSTYRHKVTGEIRVYSALETDGCAYANEPVWDFVSRAEHVRSDDPDFVSGGYAIVVETLDDYWKTKVA